MTEAAIKTQARVAELKQAHIADVFRAAAYHSFRINGGSFGTYKANGWAVKIGKKLFAHRELIARTIWYATKRKTGTPVRLTKEDFGGNGHEYKAVLEDYFGLTIVELPVKKSQPVTTE